MLQEQCQLTSSQLLSYFPLARQGSCSRLVSTAVGGMALLEIPTKQSALGCGQRKLEVQYFLANSL